MRGSDGEGATFAGRAEGLPAGPNLHPTDMAQHTGASPPPREARSMPRTSGEIIELTLTGMAYGAIIVGIIIFSPREIARFIYQGF